MGDADERLAHAALAGAEPGDVSDDSSEAAPEAATIFEVVVPDDLQPGDVLQTTTPCGVKVKFAVPEGMAAGDCLTFTLPSHVIAARRDAAAVGVPATEAPASATEQPDEEEEEPAATPAAAAGGSWLAGLAYSPSRWFGEAGAATARTTPSTTPSKEAADEDPPPSLKMMGSGGGSASSRRTLARWQAAAHGLSESNGSPSSPFKQVVQSAMKNRAAIESPTLSTLGEAHFSMLRWQTTHEEHVRTTASKSAKPSASIPISPPAAPPREVKNAVLAMGGWQQASKPTALAQANLARANLYQSSSASISSVIQGYGIQERANDAQRRLTEAKDHLALLQQKVAAQAQRGGPSSQQIRPQMPDVKEQLAKLQARLNSRDSSKPQAPS